MDGKGTKGPGEPSRRYWETGPTRDLSSSISNGARQSMRVDGRSLGVPSEGLSSLQLANSTARVVRPQPGTITPRQGNLFTPRGYSGLSGNPYMGAAPVQQPLDNAHRFTPMRNLAQQGGDIQEYIDAVVRDTPPQNRMSPWNPRGPTPTTFTTPDAAAQAGRAMGAENRLLIRQDRDGLAPATYTPPGVGPKSYQRHSSPQESAVRPSNPSTYRRGGAPQKSITNASSTSQKNTGNHQPRISPTPTQVLSLMCQARSFNLAWRKEPSSTGKARLTLILNETEVTAGEYDSEQNAKYALAQKALDTVCLNWHNLVGRGPTSNGQRKTVAAEPSSGVQHRGPVIKKEQSPKIKKEEEDGLVSRAPFRPSTAVSQAARSKPATLASQATRRATSAVPNRNDEEFILEQIRNLAGSIARSRTGEAPEVARAFLEGMAVATLTQLQLNQSSQAGGRRSQSPSRRDRPEDSRRERSPARIFDYRDRRRRDHYAPNGSTLARDHYAPSGSTPSTDAAVRPAGSRRTLGTSISRRAPGTPAPDGRSGHRSGGLPDLASERWDHGGYHSRYPNADCDDREDRDEIDMS